MRVISRSRLVEFWNGHSGAEGPLTHWFNHVSNKSTAWETFADVRKDFNSADKVGDCYIFDIGGNNFRLIAKIIRERVYILKIMTHAEYDKQKWVADCNCMKKLKKDRAIVSKKSAKKAKRKK